MLGTLWDMVWAGEVTNDTLGPLRSRLAEDRDKGRRQRIATRRSHRLGPPGSEGRWSLLPAVSGESETERRLAFAECLLERHGVLTREAVHAEGPAGGFSSVYDVLKAMEERGRVRRGYFVAGLGGTQFARPGAEDRLRSLRTPSARPKTWLLSATDPASPFGSTVLWPETPALERPLRIGGASVIVFDGKLVAYLARGDARLTTFLSPEEPARSLEARAVARGLFELFARGRRALVIGEIDGGAPETAFVARFLLDAGFTRASHGLFARAAGQAQRELGDPA
ncbi:MAG: hypothetical protein U0263_28475 [Polyangiaceae bacterium]